MQGMTKTGALTLAAVLAALPALAQTSTSVGTVAPTASSPAAVAPAAHNESATRAAGATLSDRPMMTDGGEVRASKVIGSSVYNDRNEKIGSIDDLVIGRDNKPLTAIISVGGFLGAGNKHVAVPYTALKFGDATTGGAKRVVMPGATKDSLTSMSDYHLSSAHRDAGVRRG